MQKPPECTVVWRYTAVAQGTIVVRDQANQQQDVAALSRDTEHANDSISPIFDKEKEQKRLQTAQLIGEPGSQVADIARTQGQIEATEAGKKELAKNNINQPDATLLRLKRKRISKRWKTAAIIRRPWHSEAPAAISRRGFRRRLRRFRVWRVAIWRSGRDECGGE